MKIVMTNNALDLRAGSESYLETVSSELRRLGHEVTFYSPQCGDMAARLRQRGFAVVDDLDDLPREVDVIHGQHVNAVAQVRTRLPRVPLVFVTHSWAISVEDPLAELGAAAYVALNDLTLRRLQAHAATVGAPVVRLTQPVEVSFADDVLSSIAETPRRAVAVSRHLKTRSDRLAEACAGLGIAFERLGGDGHEAADPRQQMRSADIVVALGRGALEGMAAGRAVLVLDESMGGSWVTATSYAALEADGFTGLHAPGAVEDLPELLRGYSHELGPTSRRLVVEHHTGQRHAVDLVHLYTSVADARSPVVVAPTVALLAQERLVLERRAVEAEWHSAALVKERDLANIEVEHVRDELSELAEEVQRLQRRRNQLRRQRNRLRLAERDRDLAAQERASRWSVRRLTGVVAGVRRRWLG